MEYTHEIIDFGSHIPVKFFIHSIGHVGRHWHQSVELLFVLSGKVQIFVRDQIHTLFEDDLIIINSYDIHELHGDHAVLAAFQIKLSMFDSNIEDFTQFYFDCNSAMDADRQKYLPIKQILARMIAASTREDHHREVMNKGLAYGLLYELLTSFGHKAPQLQRGVNQPEMLERMGEILNYIHQNYTQKISLGSTAEHFFISQAYLSRQFKKLIGVNFYDYLTEIRLKHAVALLLSTDGAIEQIASDSGFLNARAFVSAFKNAYGIRPSEYRKSKCTSSDSNGGQTTAMPRPPKGRSNLDNYFDFEPSRYLTRLAGYLDAPAQTQPQKPSAQAVVSIITDYGTEKLRLRHTWRRLVCVGKAYLLLHGEVRDALRLLQKNIGYEYIKFHGIFDDQMMLYQEDEKGHMRLSFIYVDKVFDFLRSVHLRPLLQLSFMPGQLADGGHRIFEGSSCIAPPRDIKKWDALVEAFMRHLINRYGMDEVSRWPVCVWNEPDTSTEMFGLGSEAQYRRLYAHTWRTVKEICPQIHFGSSSYVYDTLLDPEWNEDFIRFCTDNQCMPDFINFHFYPMVPHGSSEHLQYHRDPDAMNQILCQIIQMPLYHSLPAPRYCMTEWNSTVSHRDWLNDTAFKGAYVAKNILENYDAVECFGYWSCTDLIEEQPMAADLFHGGLGMLALCNLPKPPYHVFCMLAKLGDSLLDRGDGYFITRRGDAVVAILYNYCHYCELYAQGELFNMTQTDRYTAFTNEKTLSLQIHLTGLPASKYRLKETYVNKNHGSSFDQWLHMGARDMNADEMDILGKLASPMVKIQEIVVEKQGYTYEVTLEPHEVRCVELTVLR